MRKVDTHPKVITKDQFVSSDIAKEILGINFLGREEIEESYRGIINFEALLKIPSIPYSEEELDKNKYSHILFAGYPLTIADIYSLTPSLFWPFNSKIRINNIFTDKRVGLNWYFIRKRVELGSIDKSVKQQKAMLGQKERFPFACELVYLLVLYYKVHNIRLFEDIYIRCWDRRNRKVMAYVVSYDKQGICIKECSEFGQTNIGMVSLVV